MNGSLFISHLLHVNIKRINPVVQRLYICTSSFVSGKNAYTTPTRDIIIENDHVKKYLQIKRESAGLDDPNKNKTFLYYENRNPRHLEHLGFNKPSGFTTLYESRNFYNKLNLMMTHRHTKAFVENINGQILCSASTTEYYIAKRLHSSTDVCAVVNIARILAERCKKIGITRVHWFTKLDRRTEKVREFEGILNNNGIILSELPLKILQGPSQTLPPPRPKRKYPGPLKTGFKRRGTIMRKKEYYNL